MDTSTTTLDTKTNTPNANAKPFHKRGPKRPFVKKDFKKNSVQAQVKSAEAQAKKEKAERIKELITYLNTKFPKCFILEGEVRPYKVHILQDVWDSFTEEELQKFSKTAIRRALRYYTHRNEYLNAIKVGAVRCDLEGNDAGVIVESEVEYAKNQIVELEEQRKKKIEESKAQKAKASFKRKPFNRNNAADGDKPQGEGKFNRFSKPGFKKFNNGERKPYQGQRRSFNNAPSQDKPAPTASAKAFTVIPQAELKVGMDVRVVLGARTVKAVIRELNKDCASVELGGMGMIAKVSYDHVGK